jgi:TPR repeat protein
MKILCSLLLAALLSACASVPPEGDVHELSLRTATKIAEAGDEEAIHDLCYRYIYGRGAKLDYAEALNWCRQGAALGIDSSEVLLAEIYYNGHGTPVNYAEALSWYQAAAAQGHPHALLMLYHMYNNGTGTTANRDLALSYLREAANDGYQPAIDELDAQQSESP